MPSPFLKIPPFMPSPFLKIRSLCPPWLRNTELGFSWLDKKERSLAVGKMDFRMPSKEDDDDDDDETVSYNPPPTRESAFSKPQLPSSSSPLSDRGAGARNDARHSSPDPSPATLSSGEPKASSYRECLRNHAASLGKHVLDGCGEFMPGEADAMKCAACGCHRSFHRWESESDHLVHSRHPYFGGRRIPLLLPPPTTAALQKKIQSFGNSGAGSATESSSEELGLAAAAGAGSVHKTLETLSPKKRIRTKFTGEQKVKMMEFAERIGWKIQMQDEAEMEKFFAEIGVSRQVFKVWMHNNKHSIRKQQQQQQNKDQNL